MTEQQQRELAAGLKALADSTRDASASPKVALAVTSALRRKPQPRWSGRFLPVAAALLLTVGASLWTARISPPAAPVDPAGFLALPGAERLPFMESANIVRVSLPVAALPAYGVAVADFKTESVEADLLVAQDGRARAIRLVTEANDMRSANND